MTVMEKRCYSAPALEKGLQIIEDLAGSRQALSLAELADLQGRTGSELFRMLNCLERLGYVWRDPVSGKYTLSLKLHYLAMQEPRMSRLLKVAEAPMETLSRVTGQSCHLCVLERSQVLIMKQVEGGGQVAVRMNMSGALDPFVTTSGYLLASRLSEEALDVVLRDSAYVGGLSRPKVNRLRRELKYLAGEDLLERESDRVLGVRDISVRVGSENTICASLTLCQLIGRESNEEESDRLKIELRACAERISSALEG